MHVIQSVGPLKSFTLHPLADLFVSTPTTLRSIQSHGAYSLTFPPLFIQVLIYTVQSELSGALCSEQKCPIFEAAANSNPDSRLRVRILPLSYRAPRVYCVSVRRKNCVPSTDHSAQNWISLSALESVWTNPDCIHRFRIQPLILIRAYRPHNWIWIDYVVPKFPLVWTGIDTLVQNLLFKRPKREDSSYKVDLLKYVWESLCPVKLGNILPCSVTVSPMTHMSHPLLTSVTLTRLSL